MNKIYLTPILAIFLMVSCSTGSVKTCYHWKYPRIAADTAVNVYFGKKVVDPYRNLENLEDTSVRHWLHKERKFCDSVLDLIPGRASLLQQVTKLADSSDVHSDVPIPANGKLFFCRTFTKEKIEKLYCSDIAVKQPVELFSTEELDKKTQRHYTITYLEPSYSRKYLVFALSSNGNEKSTIRIMDVKKKMVLPERIPWAMGGNPEWLPDESGFFYWQARNTDVK